VKAAWVILLSLSLGACEHLGFRGFTEYDERSVTVLTANLFDQRLANPMADDSWKADWLFRRARLELIDQSLRITRPDMIVFQDLIAKRGSPSDSDRNILAQGSLEGYQWHSYLDRFYEDTQEKAYQSLAVSLPLKIDRSYQGGIMPVGKAGAVSFYRLIMEDEPILVVNANMPSSQVSVDAWYPILLDLIRQQLERSQTCLDRLIVTGYLPGYSAWSGYQNLLQSLQLKDSSAGYCEVNEECLTGAAVNDIFRLTTEGDAGGRFDKVLVPRSTIVLASQRAMDNFSQTSRHAERYGLDKLWPTRRFAWLANLRLARCQSPNS
jgi:hypothetical protein